MNLMQLLQGIEQSSAPSNPLSQMASQFGLDANQVQQALGALMPAVSGGLKQNMQRPGGAEALAAALSRGNHARYLEQPQAVFEQGGIDEGNAILGHIFGSKDVSRGVAQRASEQTGIGGDLLKKMLPAVASMAMGALGKQSQGMDQQSLAAGFQQLAGGGQSSGGGLGQAVAGLMGGGGGGQAGGQLGGLAALLDTDGDGSVADDLMNLAGKFLKR